MISPEYDESLLVPPVMNTHDAVVPDETMLPEYDDHVSVIPDELITPDSLTDQDALFSSVGSVTQIEPEEVCPDEVFTEHMSSTYGRTKMYHSD